MTDARNEVAERYASAFFDLAGEENKGEALERDMRALRAVIDESEELRALLRSPVYDAEDKRRALDAILDKLGADALTRNLIALMAQKGRLFALDGAAKAYLDMAAKARGEVSAEAISAHPLTDEQIAALRGQIEQAVGKSVNLEAKTDPSLLGGLIVKVGSRMLDSSLRTRLARLHTRLREA
jgi:F-type H+-transporting ATPase subunit delta